MRALAAKGRRKANLEMPIRHQTASLAIKRRHPHRRRQERPVPSIRTRRTRHDFLESVDTVPLCRTSSLSDPMSTKRVSTRVLTAKSLARKYLVVFPCQATHALARKQQREKQCRKPIPLQEIDEVPRESVCDTKRSPRGRSLTGRETPPSSRHGSQRKNCSQEAATA